MCRRPERRRCESWSRRSGSPTSRSFAVLNSPAGGSDLRMEGSIGVELVVGNKPRLFTDVDAFLPNDPWEMTEAVHLLDGARGVLETVLAMSGNAASCSCVVHLALVDTGALAVALNGEWVGHIVGRHILHQLVEKVSAAGLPTTANARLTASTPDAELESSKH